MTMIHLVEDKSAAGVVWLMLLLYAGLGLVSMLVWCLRWQGRQAAWGTQILSWWRLFPVLSLAWWGWPLGAAVMALLVGGLALRELSLHSPSPAARRQLHWFGGVSLCLQALYALNWPDALGGLVLGVAFAALGVGAVWKWQAHCKNSEANEWLLFAVFCYQAAGMWAAAALPADTPAQAAAWFWWLCILTALNDVAQFVTGKCLGRSKIAPSISPNKTWQGFMGGLCVSAVLALGMGWVLELATWPTLLGLGLVLGAMGFLGDLSLSAVKRRLKIKDFSDLIPGHGGILDRVDSLLLTAPTLCLYLYLESLL